FVAPVQRVEENRRSLELRNGRIPRIFRNNLAYEDDTNSQFACILRNFGLEHSFVHLQTAGAQMLFSDRLLGTAKTRSWYSSPWGDEGRRGHPRFAREPLSDPARRVRLQLRQRSLATDIGRTQVLAVEIAALHHRVGFPDQL